MAGSLEKRGEDTYRLRVSQGTDGNGKRIQHRKTIKAKSKREAEKELAKFITEIEAGTFIESPKKTFKEFAEFWLDSFARKNLKQSTVYGYEQMLINRIFPTIGHIPIEKLKPLHLQQFYSNLQDNGIRMDGKPGGLSNQTIKHHHNCISAILQDALEWDVLAQNVAHKVTPPKVAQKEADFYTEEEAIEILNALAKEDFKYATLYTLAFTTGLRKGELLGLEWSHIDFIAKELHIKQTSLYNPKAGIYTDIPKSRTSIRSLSISDSELLLLRKLKISQDKQKELQQELWIEHNRLFTQWNGKPMHPSTVNSEFKKFLRKNQFPVKSFHTTRHTNITLLLANNVDIKTVIHRAGHADGIMTINKYGHALKSKDRDAAIKLENIFLKEV
ncbi:tyrosine-type recombinase/integrase [Pseudalkalibacillus sp. NRS-1564]|uniref:tyrosine-type recombinase/integrase n=1 Tax=Pseudalkalibacillus sp. NRS-1564 TaxID=3233900 RepID=UPI003D2D401E